MTRSRAAGLLVPALTVLVSESLRVSFPLLYGFAEEIGFVRAAGVIPLVFAASALLAPLGRVLGTRWALTLTVGGSVLARLVVQAQDTPGLIPTLVALLLGMTGLALALRVAAARAGAPTATAALLGGLATDAALRLLLVTWDAPWQPGPVGWVVAVALAGTVGLALLALLTGPGAWGPDRVRAGLVPGPLLALATLVLASPPFVASSAGTDLPVAGAVVTGGLAVAAVAVRFGDERVCRAAAVVLPVALWFLTGPDAVSGVVVLLLVPVTTVAAALLTARALRPAVGGAGDPAGRTALGAAGGAVLLVLVLMPYQISYDLDLLRSVPPALWPALGGVGLGLLALARRGRGPTPRHAAGAPRVLPTLAGALVLLAAPVWLAATTPRVPEGGDGRVRVVTFNIHSAVDWYGRLDPEQVARVLEAQQADVVLLQEVSRGWPIGGGLDSASWLARRLGMTYAYGPAADQQFGNAVLADRRLLDAWSGRMGRGEGPMARGFVGVEVAAGESTLRAWSTHLQHREDTTRTRREQAAAVLAAWGGQDRTVIGGDLNSRPGSPDLEPWFDGTGLRSAQDEAGDPAWNTSPALDADHRIDWLLVTPDLEVTGAAVPETLASDHRPVAVTVLVGR